MPYEIDGKYVRIAHKDGEKVLTAKEKEFYRAGCPIPSTEGYGLWELKRKIDDKIIAGIKSGKIKPQKQDNFTKLNSNVMVISDNLGNGVQGMISHADGKKYDSKSGYYKSLKQQGLVIDDRKFNPDAKKAPVHNEKAFDKAFSQAMERHT